MKNIQSALNNKQYQEFLEQTKELNESQYKFVQKAVLQRMTQNKTLFKRIKKWLDENHEF